jgi:hypothetical protein
METRADFNAYIVLFAGSMDGIEPDISSGYQSFPLTFTLVNSHCPVDEEDFLPLIKYLLSNFLPYAI